MTANEFGSIVASPSCFCQRSSKSLSLYSKKTFIWILSRSAVDISATVKWDNTANDVDTGQQVRICTLGTIPKSDRMSTIPARISSDRRWIRNSKSPAGADVKVAFTSCMQAACKLRNQLSNKHERIMILLIDRVHFGLLAKCAFSVRFACRPN